MAVLEVLSEMVGAEKLLGLVALAKLVLRDEMLLSLVPIGCGLVCKLVSAIATYVERAACRWSRRRLF